MTLRPKKREIDLKTARLGRAQEYEFDSYSNPYGAVRLVRRMNKWRVHLTDNTDPVREQEYRVIEFLDERDARQFFRKWKKRIKESDWV